MKLHERTLLVQRSRNEMQALVIRIQERDDLTDLEALGILNEISAQILKYALRAERHPGDPEQPADIE